jgi:hypothetical protein
VRSKSANGNVRLKQAIDRHPVRLRSTSAIERLPELRRRFVPRPIRPSRNWKGDNFLGKDPASTKLKHKPVDSDVHVQFAAAIKTIPPHKR